jgi:hypothetical protein
MRYLIALCVFCAFPALAGEPVVLDVKASHPGMGWRFDVTVSHADTGWDHFADGWEALDSGGDRLGYRELMYPHVTEQPFTRSLTGVMIPDGVRSVWIRARCSADGWAGTPVEVTLDH